MFKKAAEILRHHVGMELTISPSPVMNWLKPTVLKVEEGSIAFQYVVRKEMTNPFGTLHGGITATIIDDIIGATLICYGEDAFYMSVNLVVDYFSSAREGDVIIAESTINKKGNQLVNAQCEVWNSDRSRLLAKGYTNLLKTVR